MAATKTPALALVRFKAAVAYPYFSTIIFGLIPHEVEKDHAVKTFSVDAHMRLYYNPEMFDTCSQDELVGILIHEINHVLRGHHDRGKLLNAELFNIAGDLEINDDIIDEKNCGVTLPEWVITPKKYNLPNDQVAEWYYHKLIEKADKNKTIQEILEGKGGGKGDKSKPGSKPGGGSCGSIAHGGKDPHEVDDPNDPNNPGHSEGMVDYYRKATAEDIQAHSKSRGNVPGYLERWAKKHLKPKVDWKKELRHTIATSINTIANGMADFTRTKSSRRQASNLDFILPGFFQPTPTVGVIIDTSGSMSTKMIEQAVAETGAVLKTSRSNVLLVSVDAEVHSIGQVKHPKDIKLSGGGGTDMRLGYKALAESKVKPDLIICITDGYTPWPKEPNPRTKNIICLTTKQGHGAEAEAPKWAKVIWAESEE